MISDKGVDNRRKIGDEFNPNFQRAVFGMNPRILRDEIDINFATGTLESDWIDSLGSRLIARDFYVSQKAQLAEADKPYIKAGKTYKLKGSKLIRFYADQMDTNLSMLLGHHTMRSENSGEADLSLKGLERLENLSDEHLVDLALYFGLQPKDDFKKASDIYEDMIDARDLIIGSFTYIKRMGTDQTEKAFRNFELEKTKLCIETGLDLFIIGALRHKGFPD